MTLGNGPVTKFYLIKLFGHILRKNGIDPVPLSSADIENNLRRLGVDFTDCEGNYWGHINREDGKRVRVCIPVR